MVFMVLKSAAFITTFQKRWRALTRCRTGYIVPLCSNARG